MIAALRERWGGIRPSLQVEKLDFAVSRWDDGGEGPGQVISFEGFGLTFTIFVGKTPRRRL